jgi:hypothetical protein
MTSTCPIYLPVRWNPFRLSPQPSLSTSSSSAKLLSPRCRPFPTVNRKHLFMNIFFFALSHFDDIKTHNETLLFGTTSLKHGSHFDYWNQTLNIRMRVCYLDCYEAGLCCYLVIHIQIYYVHYSCLCQFVAYILTRIRFFVVFPSPSRLIPRLSLELQSESLPIHLTSTEGPNLVSLCFGGGGVASVRLCPVSGTYSVK